MMYLFDNVSVWEKKLKLHYQKVFHFIRIYLLLYILNFYITSNYLL